MNNFKIIFFLHLTIYKNQNRKISIFFNLEFVYFLKEIVFFLAL